MEVPLKVILPKSELIVILDRSVFDALKESSFVDHFVPQLITIEKYTPFPILPKINNRPAVVTDTLYLIVAVLSFIVILTSISLILVLLFYPIPTHVQEKFSVPSIWSVVIVTSKPLSLILTSHELLRYIFALTQDTSLAMYPTLIIIVALLGLCNTFNMYKPPIPDVVT